MKQGTYECYLKFKSKSFRNMEISSKNIKKAQFDNISLPQHFRLVQVFGLIVAFIHVVHSTDPFYQLEYRESTVSYNLESRTVPLDDVFFPSTLICNMNNLRKSFILEVLHDPKVQANPIQSNKTFFVSLSSSTRWD